MNADLALIRTLLTILPESCDFLTMDVGKPVVCISQHNQNPITFVETKKN